MNKILTLILFSMFLTCCNLKLQQRQIKVHQNSGFYLEKRASVVLTKQSLPVCGGTFVRKNVIVTAEHCLYRRVDYIDYVSWQSLSKASFKFNKAKKLEAKVLYRNKIDDVAVLRTKEKSPIWAVVDSFSVKFNPNVIYVHNDINELYQVSTAQVVRINSPLKIKNTNEKYTMTILRAENVIPGNSGSGVFKFSPTEERQPVLTCILSIRGYITHPDNDKKEEGAGCVGYRKISSALYEAGITETPIH